MKYNRVAFASFLMFVLLPFTYSENLNDSSSVTGSIFYKESLMPQKYETF